MSFYQSIKLVILDLKMPVMGGMETLALIRQQYPNLPVIMLSGSRDTEDVVEALKHGAVDFLNKPFDGERLKITVENTLKLKALSAEVTLLKSEKEGQFKFENLIGHDNGLARSIAIGRKAASSDIQVFITGETGTGKEIFARAIHGESLRTGRPFVAINCGAIPSQLVESILFGHEKGAFTGAINKSLGKFREAHGGTIFLDGIGELPLDMQVKLLRVLQQREVEPVGADKPVPVDVRIISATNRNLANAVSEGKFREDLYFRLNVLQIDLPPLRERREDIPLLVRHFIDRFCARENRRLKTITTDADNVLINYPWHGNVRELENTIHRAIIMNETDVLEPQDFQKTLDIQANPSSSGGGMSISVMTHQGTFKTSETIERELMQMALDHYAQNITQAAAAIGMAKSTFYKKMKL